MESKNPLVTICFITHNSDPFLEKALSSVINQDYDNFKVLISDNESTDNTLKIIDSYKNKYSNIILRNNTPDIKPGKFYDGCYDNCNGCIKSNLIEGEYVGFYHSDDVYEKEIVRKEVEFFAKHPEVVAVFTLGNLIDQDDKFIRKYKLPREIRHRDVLTFPELFKTLLNYGNKFLITPTFMIRTEILKELGPFSTEGLFGTSADLEMWLRIAKKYPIGIVKEPLINRRVGGGGKQYNMKRIETTGFFKVMDYYLKDNIVTDKKSLRQYKYQKNFDNTLISMNLLVQDKTNEAKNIINKSFSPDHLIAFLENMSLLRFKVLVLQLFIFIGVNLGLGKQLGEILKRI